VTFGAWNEEMPRHAIHRVENALIANTAGANLLCDHAGPGSRISSFVHRTIIAFRESGGSVFSGSLKAQN